MGRRGFAKGLSSGLDSLIEQRQQGQKNAIDALVQRAALRESGYDVQETPGFLGFGKRMSLVKSPTADTLPEGFVRVGGKAVQDPTYYNPGREREKARIKSEEDARAMQMFRDMSSSGNVPVGTTMRHGRFNIPLNPKLTGDEASAVSAQEVFTPLAEGLKEDTKSGVFNSKVGNIGRTYRQYAAGQPNALFTSYDPKLQATQGKINSIRRYVFGEGGKQLTPYEANIVNALIKPTGKSDEQYDKDLDEAMKLIESKSRLALGGANAASNGESGDSDVTEDDIQFTMQKHGLTREQVLEQLNG